MYEHIAANQRKTWLIMTLFLVIIALLGYALGILWNNPYAGVAVAATIGIVFTLISYYTGDRVALSVSGAVPAHPSRDARLVHIVEGLAIAAGIPKPAIYILPGEAINAFATGRNPEHASVAVTKGAIAKLGKYELEGVIAHELSHIKNYDIRVMMVAMMLVGIIVLISDLALRSLWFNPSGGSREDHGRAGAILLVIGIVLAILAPFFAQLLKLAVSRQREFLADASGALISRHPRGLADALKKIRDDHAPPLQNATKATAHLFIANPLRQKKERVRHLFSTHPDINERIRRLEGM